MPGGGLRQVRTKSAVLWLFYDDGFPYLASSPLCLPCPVVPGPTVWGPFCPEPKKQFFFCLCSASAVCTFFCPFIFCWFFLIGWYFDCNQRWVGLLADFPSSFFFRERKGKSVLRNSHWIMRYSFFRLGSTLEFFWGLFDCNQGVGWIVGGLPLSSFGKKTGTTSLPAWHHISLQHVGFFENISNQWGWSFGWISSASVAPMDSIQVGKDYFVKENWKNPGFQAQNFS